MYKLSIVAVLSIFILGSQAAAQRTGAVQRAGDCSQVAPLDARLLKSLRTKGALYHVANIVVLPNGPVCFQPVDEEAYRPAGVMSNGRVLFDIGTELEGEWVFLSTEGRRIRYQNPAKPNLKPVPGSFLIGFETPDTDGEVDEVTVETGQAGDAVRTFNLIDTFPLRFERLNDGADGQSGTVVSWTLEIRVNRIDMA